MAEKSPHISKRSPLRFSVAVSVLVVFSLCLLAGRIIETESLRFSFLFTNLILAFLPLLLTLWLVRRIDKHGWLRWKQIVLSMAWITFLPNSFYLITDLIHLRRNFEADLIFDIILISSFIFAGVLFGLLSMHAIHKRLLLRMGEGRSYLVMALIVLAVSFAICLGRYTRWNTWDILLRPAGLLFDVSEKFINPEQHLQTYETTLLLFGLLMCLYTVFYEGLRLARQN